MKPYSKPMRDEIELENGQLVKSSDPTGGETHTACDKIVGVNYSFEALGF